MFPLRHTIPVTVVLLFVPLALCYCCSVVGASDVFEANPIEQEDVNTIDEVSRGATSEVFGATPAEQDDTNTIDDISGDATADGFEATPAEQDDIKTIDQLNNQ